MGKFESIHIYPYIRDKTITYLGYKDDLFFIWNGIEGGATIIHKIPQQKAPLH